LWAGIIAVFLFLPKWKMYSITIIATGYVYEKKIVYDILINS